MAALLIDAAPAGAQATGKVDDGVNLAPGGPGPFQADTIDDRDREPTTSNPFGKRARLMVDGQSGPNGTFFVETNAMSLGKTLRGRKSLQPSSILRSTTTLVAVDSREYAQAQTSQRTPNTPDFRVQVWGDIMVDFSKLIWAYFDLRSELEKGLPALKVTDDPAETRRAMQALAEKVRVARAEAKEGDIFTPTASSEFRKALHLQMSAGTWRDIIDDNPGPL
ncbi:MAG: hypothetical protein ABI818_11310 [Acidobacteriota bacterium]